jgi:hypothetical protein
MRTPLFLFVLTSLQFYAAVPAQAQSAGGAASGIDDSCAINPAAPQGDTVLFFTRVGMFLQSSSSQVTPDSQVMYDAWGQSTNSAPFSATMVFVPGTNSADAPLIRSGAAVCSVPQTSEYGGSMTNFAFGTETALAAGFPAGSYSAQYSAGDGSIISVPLTLPDFNLPTPTIANFDELQSSLVGQPFTVRWLPFENANLTNSSITLRIEEISDYGEVVQTVFLAPNYCTNIVLLPTDAEMTVPAGILEPGNKYQGELCFGSTAYAAITTVPPLLFEAADSKQTRFPLGGAVVPVPSVTLASIVPSGPGTFTVTVNTSGTPSVIVDTSVDLQYWSYYALIPAGPGGVTTFDFTPSASEPARFYRILPFH